MNARLEIAVRGPRPGQEKRFVASTTLACRPHEGEAIWLGTWKQEVDFTQIMAGEPMVVVLRDWRVHEESELKEVIDHLSAHEFKQQ